MDKEKKDQSLFLKLIPYLDRYGILILLLLMIIALHIMQPEVFLSWRNVPMYLNKFHGNQCLLWCFYCNCYSWN